MSLFIKKRISLLKWFRLRSVWSSYSPFINSVRISSSSLFDILESMPKQKASTDLRHLRLKAKSSSSERPKPCSVIYLSVLGNGAKGTARALYMFTDQGRYLFNCGEGTQRLAYEHKMKLAKLEHIFITHKSWENVGGLPGLSLTVQDIGVPEIALHGPPGIEKLFSMTEKFMATKDLKITQRSHTDGFYRDNCMEVQYIPLYSAAESRNASDNCDLLKEYTSTNGVLKDGCEEDLNIKNTEESSDLPPAAKKQKISPPEKDVSVAYICKIHSKPGQLVLEKCVEQGVPPGPLLGELKNGKDITLPNGKLVKSQDVVTPEDPGPVFIVLECPSEDFLDALLAEQKFKQHQESLSCFDIPMVIVHFTPPEIFILEKYQEWMSRFPASTFHLVLNSANKSLASVAVHRIQHMLHLLHPQIFPLLQESSKKDSESSAQTSSTVIQADNFMSFYLRPRKGLERSTSVCIEPEVYVKEAMDAEGFKESLQQLKEQLTAQTVVTPENCYPEVVFLGTGSSIPSKVRNVSGILVNVSPETSILMDCGEGTCGQLHRLFGQQTVTDVLCRISGIFLSHLHADHHLGLIQLLKERKNAFELSSQPYMPVHLLAPKQIFHWLASYHLAFEHLLPLFRLVPNSELCYDGHSLPEVNYKQLVNQLGLTEVDTVPVKHCKNAFGIVLKCNEWKVVYSGDTMPCETLIEAGQGCSLLIHEATMEDDLEEEARFKTHSTTSQAIEVGDKMKAKFVTLTHFSQRYAKVPLFNENFHSRVGCAFDNMKIRPCDLPIIPLFIPSLKCLFAEHYEELKVKKARRMRLKNQSS